MGGIVGHRIGVRRDATDGTAGRSLPLLAHPALDGDLDGVVELVATTREELDAVVGHRVVRGRQHHAEVGAERAGQVGDAGSRQHAEQEHVDTGRREARHDGGLEELPGNARVPTHHGAGTVPREVAAVGQDMCRGNGKVQGQLRRQSGVGQAPDPVRAEKACHAEQVSAC